MGRDAMTAKVADRWGCGRMRELSRHERWRTSEGRRAMRM